MKRYRVDLEESEIAWTGVQPEKKVSGKIFFKAGMICLDEAMVPEGEIIIDMHSIQAMDEKLGPEARNQLAADLRSINFFNADVYPTALLKIKAIKVLSQEDLRNDNSQRITNPTHEVTASLTIKDTTHEIVFPVKITFVENHIKVKTELKIDRTKWGINYMMEESYGDKKIESDVLIAVKLTAEGIDEL